MVEHRQPICKLAFERMGATPDVLYGEDVGSNYQGQVTMLSKHFREQPAGRRRATPRARCDTRPGAGSASTIWRRCQTSDHSSSRSCW